MSYDLQIPAEVAYTKNDILAVALCLCCCFRMKNVQST